VHDPPPSSYGGTCLLLPSPKACGERVGGRGGATVGAGGRVMHTPPVRDEPDED